MSKTFGALDATEDEKRAAVDLYKQGLSIREVAKKLDRGYCTVHRWLSAARVVRTEDFRGVPKNPVTEADKRRAVALRKQQGMTLQQIADEIGVSTSTIHRWVAAAEQAEPGT